MRRREWVFYPAVFALTVAAVFLVLWNPVFAVIPALPLALLLIPELPVFGIVVSVLSIRAIVDGVGSASGFTSPTALTAGFLVLVGVAVLTRSHRGFLAVLLVAAIAGVSAYFGARMYGDEVWREYLSLLSTLAVVVVCLNQKKPIRRDQAALSVQLIATIPAMVALFQVATGTGLREDGAFRAAGTFAHPNSAALFFGIALVVSIYRYGLVQKNGSDRIFIALFAGALLATVSIGGILSTLTMVIVYFIVRRGVSGFRKIGLLVLVLGCAVAVAFSPFGTARLGGFFGDAASSSAVDSLQWRLDNWAAVFGQIWDAPVFGHGYGATSTGRIIIGSIPHNEYLRSLLEVGIVGTIAIGILALVGIAVQIQRIGRPEFQNAPALVIGIASGLMVNALAANTFLYSMSVYLLVIVLCAIGSKHVPSSLVTSEGINFEGDPDLYASVEPPYHR